eukprot:1564071-Rhodomonas_salina.1
MIQTEPKYTDVQGGTGAVVVATAPYSSLLSTTLRASRTLSAPRTWHDSQNPTLQDQRKPTETNGNQRKPRAKPTPHTLQAWCNTDGMWRVRCAGCDSRVAG